MIAWRSLASGGPPIVLPNVGPPGNPLTVGRVLYDPSGEDVLEEIPVVAAWYSGREFGVDAFVNPWTRIPIPPSRYGRIPLPVKRQLRRALSQAVANHADRILHALEDSN